jgi:hypothetical protein
VCSRGAGGAKITRSVPTEFVEFVAYNAIAIFAALAATYGRIRELRPHRLKATPPPLPRIKAETGTGLNSLIFWGAAEVSLAQAFILGNRGVELCLSENYGRGGGGPRIKAGPLTGRIPTAASHSARRHMPGDPTHANMHKDTHTHTRTQKDSPLREVRPVYFLAPASILENAIAQVVHFRDSRPVKIRP